MPKASIIVPAYNATATLAETLDSLCAQTFDDYEIIVIDDGSTDATADLAANHGDPRIRLVSQRNRGLAGARNGGIAAAKGEFIGFCDADDLWRPTKLANHIAHLEANPLVGLSFAGSELIDVDGQALGLAQAGRLTDITPAHVFKRNPVGNGSAPVFRRAALDSIAFRPEGETERDWWFDETFRQSEDIECWLRFALTTDWVIEGISGLLTRYRIVPSGLSAATGKQFVAWERMVAKLTPLAPDFFAEHAPAARAYQLRYLARRAVTSGNAAEAARRMRAAMRTSKRPLIEEPAKTLSTWAATKALSLVGADTFRRLVSFARHSAA